MRSRSVMAAEWRPRPVRRPSVWSDAVVDWLSARPWCSLQLVLSASGQSEEAPTMWRRPILMCARRRRASRLRVPRRRPRHRSRPRGGSRSPATLVARCCIPLSCGLTVKRSWPTAGTSPGTGWSAPPGMRRRPTAGCSPLIHRAMLDPPGESTCCQSGPGVRWWCSVATCPMAACSSRTVSRTTRPRTPGASQRHHPDSSTLDHRGCGPGPNCWCGHGMRAARRPTSHRSPTTPRPTRGENWRRRR